MLLEIAEIEVRPGAEDQFAAAMRETGVAHLAACEGVVTASFGRGVENPSKFTFNVVWTSIEAHEAARSLEDFGKFRACFGDMSISGAMSHYRMDAALTGPAA
ncbi:putative quinol monooxygenase [Novosphingobium sp. P6W]|uniref:putative quinol monooxygenase n=1 Tax=Novosphingobium sp. P6W TaxID=1609758 RepID=UPI0005C2CFA3|nr:antibiotic biosynthesis monooxygenase family protein [Novosphingobium sp. P6W]AXB75277.1 antibiotic biosynthesis monooxygenase [Novosphingobium sp. P6W]KIS32670.1 antibiotic biosynthesis monooxygenase [Novosphingobium sp. P6W]